MERNSTIDWSGFPKLPHTDIGVNPTCVFDMNFGEADEREISLNNLSESVFVDGVIKQ